MSVLEELKNKYGVKLKVLEKSPRRIYVSVAKELAHEVIRFLFREQQARFSIASGIDAREGIEILYHLAVDREGVIISLRVMVAKPELEMPTLTDFLPGANWIEREIHEMFGVKFMGHPDMRALLLPDDWPEGVYPLRKQSFESEQENTERA